MAHEEHPPAPPQVHRSGIVHYLSLAERTVLSMIAVGLVFLALLIFANSIKDIIIALLATNSPNPDTVKAFDTVKAIDILDQVLLVMMTMEIVYTITLSLESRKLIAEPFLIIGIIAAIRRTLVITAKSAQQENNATAFQGSLLELALLSFIVGVMAFSIFMMRRSQKWVVDEMTLKE